MDSYLQAAIDEAEKGLAEDGIPIGSVLVIDGKIVGRGHNRRVQDGSAVVAAEFAEFFRGGQRGFVQERRSPPRVSLRVHPAVDEFDEVAPSQADRRNAA